MWALVSPLNDNIVIKLEETKYDVEAPLFWVETTNDCKIGMYYIQNTFINIIKKVPTAIENKYTAINLLKDTDWSTFPDVVNTSITPYLTNQDEFLEYRRLIRIISLNTTDGNLVWPIKPDEKWDQTGVPVSQILSVVPTGTVLDSPDILPGLIVPVGPDVPVDPVLPVGSILPDVPVDPVLPVGSILPDVPVDPDVPVGPVVDKS
jgi:hypothetical protein